MTLEALENIIKKYERPLIGIIGAANPLPDYDSDDGYRLGYELREAVNNKGTLFTGGVPGIGVDVYSGIVDYSVEKGLDDKFFILFPEMEMEPSEDYFTLANKTKNGSLRVEKIGKDMGERRSYIAAVADLVVLINGSTGTLDETLKSLYLGKQILCLQNSGGAARVISRFKKGEVEIPLDIDKSLITTFDSISELTKYLSTEFLNKLGENK
ncbi:MAG: hypothetical protein Q7S27_03930 [Nanoarchaeota archaeon]|nr:hypothetical protein [Nanoarchaeota archaeon]